MPKHTDQQLIELSLRDPDYFGELVERYEDKLFRYIRRFSGLNKECAEDVLQEVFLKIYRNLNGYEPEFSFSSWAYRIAHNETVNYLKKNRKVRVLSLESGAPDIGKLIDILADDTDLTAKQIQRELKEKVAAILKGMPLKYREVLVLRFLEELDYSEISDILKKPMGTVATLLNRAKSQFKQIAIEHHLTPST